MWETLAILSRHRNDQMIVEGVAGGAVGRRDRRDGATPVRPLTAPAERCDAPGPAHASRPFGLPTALRSDGVDVGSGPDGAVLLHMVASDLCDWWPFAGELARRGVHALMIDLRCSGRWEGRLRWSPGPSSAHKCTRSMRSCG
jgi:hypothetical protein